MKTLNNDADEEVVELEVELPSEVRVDSSGGRGTTGDSDGGGGA